MQYSLNYSGKRFLPLKIKITQFPDGFHLKHCCLLIPPDYSPPFPLLPAFCTLTPPILPGFPTPWPHPPHSHFSHFLIPSHPTSPLSSTQSHITFVCTLRQRVQLNSGKNIFFLFPESILSVKSAQLINFLHYIGVFAGMNGICLSICL